MKKIHLFIFCLAIMQACSSDHSKAVNTDGAEEDSLLMNDSFDIITANTPAPPPQVPLKEDVQEEIDELVLNSPFYKLGCCEEESERENRCCCDEIIKKVKAMVEQDDKDLGSYLSTDQLLGPCKKKYGKAFKAILDTEPSKEKEDNSDLF